VSRSIIRMARNSIGRQGSDPGVSDTAAAWIARRDVGLTPAEDSELASWLAAKPEHREAFSFWENTWARLDRPFALGQVARLQAEIESRARARKRRRNRKIAASVASLALLLACVGLWRGSAPSAEAPPAALASTTLMLPEKQALPDGTIAELNEGARIAVNYSTASRRVVLLAGEAHFDVVPDPARPFYVNAGGVDVRAVGTAFSVQLAPAEVAVLVTHGRVAVSRETGEPDIDS
jgi:transmembrane sensor